MNKTRPALLFMLLAVSVLACAGAVQAKGLGVLTITGPGIKGELTLTGPGAWGRLEDSGFFVQDSFIKQLPENLGEGYTLTASLDMDGRLTPFVEMVYYPAEEGQPGYFHYTRRLEAGTLRTVDEWGISSLKGDNAFRALMRANNIPVQSAILKAPEVRAVSTLSPPEREQLLGSASVSPEIRPVSSFSAPAATPRVPYPTLALAAALLAVIAGAWLLRRRLTSQRNA